MKIKKSKFVELLVLALPIAAISIVSPVVLTSCGSSNSTTTPDKPDNGGTGEMMEHHRRWKHNTILYNFLKI